MPRVRVGRKDTGTVAAVRVLVGYRAVVAARQGEAGLEIMGTAKDPASKRVEAPVMAAK